MPIYLAIVESARIIKQLGVGGLMGQQEQCEWSPTNTRGRGGSTVGRDRSMQDTLIPTLVHTPMLR